MEDEATRRNILAIKGHAEDTRVMLRSMEENVSRLEGLVLTANETVANLQIQIAGLQARVLNGGPTSGD